MTVDNCLNLPGSRRGEERPSQAGYRQTVSNMQRASCLHSASAWLENWIFTLLLAVFGGFMLWQAYAISSFKSIDSAAAFPMAAAAVLLLYAPIVTLQTVNLPRTGLAADESLVRQFVRRLTPRVLVAFTIAIALYMLALEPIGFVLSSYAFLVASMAILGARR